MFQVCKDGSENRNTNRFTAYRGSFHAHYLVNKATVQKFKTLSNINVIEMSLTR